MFYTYFSEQLWIKENDKYSPKYKPSTGDV